MQQALVRHHAILHQLTELYHGHVFHTAGDSFICVFADAVAALQSALAMARALLAEPWPEVVAPLRVRMALHSGVAATQGEEYVAEPTLNRLSRVLGLSQGGQILLTQATLDALATEEIISRLLGVATFAAFVLNEFIFEREWFLIAEAWVAFYLGIQAALAWRRASAP
jgi:class 3 adenylate cyclase